MRWCKELPNIKDALIIQLDPHYDYRGYNFEGYNAEEYGKLHPVFKDLNFGIDSFSRSTKGVLRGFHGDTKTWKLIQVLFGEIQFVIMDMRDSLTKWSTIGMTLRANQPTQILVPAGVVNAHLCLSDDCVFSYKLSHPYVPQSEQIHVHWSEYPEWEIRKPITSARDAEKK